MVNLNIIAVSVVGADFVKCGGSAWHGVRMGTLKSSVVSVMGAEFVHMEK